MGKQNASSSDRLQICASLLLSTRQEIRIFLVSFRALSQDSDSVPPGSTVLEIALDGQQFKVDGNIVDFYVGSFHFWFGLVGFLVCVPP
jgi:hypothetical protein